MNKIFSYLIVVGYLFSVLSCSSGSKGVIDQNGTDAGIDTTLNWAIETVDSTGHTGYNTHLALDSQGMPGISYYLSGQSYLDTNGTKVNYEQVRFAHYNSGTQLWDTYNVGTPEEQSNAIGFAPLVYVGGSPAISFMGFPGVDLYYYRWNGSGFNSPVTVEATGFVGYDSSLAYNSSSGMVGVSYQRCYYDPQGREYCNDTWSSNKRELQFGRSTNAGGSWTVETVEGGTMTSNSGFDTSLVFDKSGNPAIAFFNKGEQKVKFARHTGGYGVPANWAITEIEKIGLNDMYISLAVDGNNNFGIAYYDEVNLDLKYAYSSDNGVTWTISYINRSGSVGKYCSLDFTTTTAPERNNLPGVTYFDAKGYALRYSFLTGASGSIRWLTKATW